MKKAGLLILFLAVAAAGLRAQDEVNINSRNEGSLFQAGISFGYFGYGYVGSRTGFTVPITAAYEKYFDEHISGGGFIGYASYGYEDSNDNGYRWTFLNFGARASYHYIHFLNDALEMDIDEEKYDFYISLMLMFESRSFSSSDDFYDDFYDNEFGVNLGPVAGFRYHLNDSFSLYFEGGRGTFGYGTFGVTAYF